MGPLTEKSERYFLLYLNFQTQKTKRRESNHARKKVALPTKWVEFDFFEKF